MKVPVFLPDACTQPAWVEALYVFGVFAPSLSFLHIFMAHVKMILRRSGANSRFD